MLDLRGGVDQRLTGERAAVLAERHGQAPSVALVLDSVLVSPYHGDIGRTVEVGRRVWERHAGDPRAELQLLGSYSHALWFAGDHDAVRALLEPRLGIDKPVVTELLTLAVLAHTAADAGDGELAERYARAAVAIVERIGGQALFVDAYAALADALRVRGKLAEARQAIAIALDGEARWPGSLGQAVALTFDAQLALAEHDHPRARARAASARAIIDRYPDVGVLADRLATVEEALEQQATGPQPGSRPSDAELRVLALLPADLTHEQIAARLHLSTDTVRSHTRRLYRRLGAHTREEALAAARERDLL